MFKRIKKLNEVVGCLVIIILIEYSLSNKIGSFQVITYLVLYSYNKYNIEICPFDRSGVK